MTDIYRYILYMYKLSLVCDTFRKNSIKAGTTKMRCLVKNSVIKTTDTKVSEDFANFMRNNSNKEMPISLMEQTCIKDCQNLEGAIIFS